MRAPETTRRRNGGMPKLSRAKLALFERYQDWAQGVAVNVHRQNGDLNGNTIDDYRQWALTALWLCLAKYSAERGNFRPWAAAAIRRHIFDQLRATDEVGRTRRAAGHRGPSVSLEDCASGHGPARRAPAGDDQRLTMLRYLLPAASRQASLDAYDELGGLLAGLSLPARAAVYLSVVQELDEWQAARILGVKPAWVSAMVARAMAFLRTGVTWRQGPRDERPVRCRQLWLFEDMV